MNNITDCYSLLTVINISEEIKRLRAEGERLLEEEQAKYRVAKRAHEDVARIKLSWDFSLRQYSQKELQSLLGTSAVVLSTKKKGRAIAEFERFSLKSSENLNRNAVGIILIVICIWEKGVNEQKAPP